MIHLNQIYLRERERERETEREKKRERERERERERNWSGLWIISKNNFNLSNL